MATTTIHAVHSDDVETNGAGESLDLVAIEDEAYGDLIASIPLPSGTKLSDRDVRRLIEQTGRRTVSLTFEPTASGLPGWLVEIKDTTLAEILELQSEAGSTGDTEMVAICDAALHGDEDAIAECARVIADAAAMAEGDEEA